MTTIEANNIREYLAAIADFKGHHFHDEKLAYSSREEFVLKHGREYRWTGEPLPEGVERGYAKECFGNAGGHVIFNEDTDLTYVEGYASWSGFAVPHAWLADAEGNVIDPTWVESDECGLCLGEGEREEATDWDEDGDECEWEMVPCRFCDGTGKVDMDQRAGNAREYLGIPFTAEAVRESVVRRGVWGMLDDIDLFRKPFVDKVPS